MVMKYLFALLMLCCPVPDFTVFHQDESIQILVPGIFHDGEVKYSDEQEEWTGLYHENGNFVLKSGRVDFVKVFDPVLDMEGEKTGIEVTVLPAQNLVLAMDSSFKGITGERIATSLSQPFRMKSGDTLTLSLPFSPETILFEKEGKAWLKAGDQLQYLTEIYPQGIDEYLEILWAGDLDGDQKIDLLINDILHYNTWINYRLFLSSRARFGEVAGEAGFLSAQGC